jgi:hypothetical protein
VYNEISSYAEDSIWIKDYILDPLAWAEAKGLLQNITDSTVAWINSGFQGSPAYVTNPTQFFENIGDQAATSFLSQNGPLSSLCSPISLNVRLALAFNQAGVSGNSSGGTNGTTGGNNSPYACTLSNVINNVQGATINGFEAGDFSQGGWAAFASLAEPQNSFYGAYLEAQSDLSTNIANETKEANNELNRGQGFLSYTTCTDDPTITDEDATYDPSIQYDATTNMYQHCQISTPGSTIKSSLDKALGSSQDSLVQASMLDEIIGALASKLVNQVLGSGGLSGVSQPQNGQPSYLSQIEAEAASSSAATGTLGGNLSTNLSQYITNATNIQSYASSSIALAENAQVVLLNASSSCRSDGDTAVVSEIGAIITGTTTPLIAQFQSDYANITNGMNNLTSLNEQIMAATSTAEIGALTQQYDNLISNHNPQSQPYIQAVPSVSDVQNAKTDNDNMQSLDNSLTQTANQDVQECYAYAHPSGGSFF